MTNHFMRTLMLLFALTVISCDNDSEKSINADQRAAIENQSEMEAFFNDAGDMSIKALNTPTASEVSGGRTKGTIIIFVENDTRFAGASITLVTDEASTPLNPKGVITIDFGDGQIDSKGNVRKGKIIVTYQGPRLVPGSKTITSFDGYSINDIAIQGTRTITSTSITTSPVFTVELTTKDEDGIATFPDQTTITRGALHVHTISFDGNDATLTWQVNGQANGKTRLNEEYSFLINRPLIFRSECALSGFSLPVEGEGLFTVNNFPFSLNFGNEGAACDNVVTVGITGLSQDITVDD